jgi:hypothetical protein
MDDSRSLERGNPAAHAFADDGRASVTVGLVPEEAWRPRH